MVRQRVLIRFAKQGDLRWASHRDLMRAWERLFRRAGVPLRQSEGFHPKPRLNLLAALAVGIEGLDEVLEVELAAHHEAAALQAALAAHAPPGLEIHAVEILPEGSRKPRASHVVFEARVPAQRREAVARRIAWLISQTRYEVERTGRTTPLELRSRIAALRLEGDRLQMRLRVDGRSGIQWRGASANAGGAGRMRALPPAVAAKRPVQSICRKRKRIYEAGDVNQRIAAGGVPHRDR
jgi:radical SAM-linked protein